MKLIYAWIEEFRNIRQCGIKFHSSFDVKVDSKEAKVFEEQLKRKASMDIKINSENISYHLYKEYNTESITALVGENGVGKTSILQAIAELHSSSDAKIILIYYDEVQKKVFLEYKNIIVTDNKCFYDEAQSEMHFFEYDIGSKEIKAIKARSYKEYQSSEIEFLYPEFPLVFYNNKL